MGRRDDIATHAPSETWPRTRFVRGVLFALLLMGMVAAAAVLPIWLG